MQTPIVEICYYGNSDVKNKVKHKKVVHLPVKEGECIRCHEPHSSKEIAYLRKKPQKLCLSCHKDIDEFWKQGVAHPPAKKNCKNCHVPHASDYKFLLKNDISKTCIRCHKVNKKLINVHEGIIPESGSCIMCHNPHGAPDESLLWTGSTHSPFAEKDCKICHGGKK